MGAPLTRPNVPLDSRVDNGLGLSLLDAESVARPM